MQDFPDPIRTSGQDLPQAPDPSAEPEGLIAGAPISVGHSGHLHHPQFPFSSGLFERIKRRNVGRVAVLYVITAYLLLEIFELFFHLLEMPAWAGRAMVLVAILGFPVALVFAWVYEITPEGLKPSNEVDPKRSIAKQTGRKLDKAIIAALSVVIAYFTADKFWLPKHIAEEKTVSRAVPATAPTSPAIPDKSVAVLPFVDMSEKYDQEYFADGLAEELINQLAKIPELKVASRTSSFSFKNKQATASEMGEALAVSALLEGSIRKSADSVRITAQLIRTKDGYHLWSETYDVTPKKVFKTQDEIAIAVVRALQLQLLSSSLPMSGSIEHAAVQDLMLQCRFLGRRGEESKMVDCYRRAVTLDPEFPLAWAWYSMQLDATDPMAREAAQRAVKLAPNSPDAHVALGWVYKDGDFAWDAADAEFKRALDLDPRSLWALRANGNIALVLGKIDEAIRHLSRAVDIDPLSDQTINELGRAFEAGGRLSEAEDAYRKVVTLSPHQPYAHFGTGEIALQRRDPKTAEREFQQVNDESLRLLGLSEAWFDLGKQKESDDSLAKLTEKYGSSNPALISMAHAHRLEREAAFDWIARAYQRRDPELPLIRENPIWRRNLEGDERYQNLLRQLKLAN